MTGNKMVAMIKKQKGKIYVEALICQDSVRIVAEKQSLIYLFQHIGDRECNSEFIICDDGDVLLTSTC